MEIWLAILFSLCLAAVIKALLHFYFLFRGPHRNLPPGPATFPSVGNFLWVGKSFLKIELALRNLHQKFGPMVTLHIGPHPVIFVTGHSLIHQALVQMELFLLIGRQPLPQTRFSAAINRPSTPLLLLDQPGVVFAEILQLKCLALPASSLILMPVTGFWKS
ncbi:hypothetical protein SLE2022_129770 [Rubroshorea leprosula]